MKQILVKPFKNSKKNLKKSANNLASMNFCWLYTLAFYASVVLGCQLKYETYLMPIFWCFVFKQMIRI